MKSHRFKKSPYFVYIRMNSNMKIPVKLQDKFSEFFQIVLGLLPLKRNVKKDI